MTHLKSSLRLGVLVLTLASASGASLSAAEAKADKASWGNLKNLSQGDLIKVVLNDAKAYECRFVSVTDEGMRVSMQAGEASFSRADVLRVSVQGGTHRLRNVGIGAGAGGGLGVATAAGYCKNEGGRNCTSGQVHAELGLLFAGIGAVVGAVIPPGQAWREVYRAK